MVEFVNAHCNARVVLKNGVSEARALLLVFWLSRGAPSGPGTVRPAEKLQTREVSVQTDPATVTAELGLRPKLQLKPLPTPLLPKKQKRNLPEPIGKEAFLPLPAPVKALKSSSEWSAVVRRRKKKTNATPEGSNRPTAGDNRKAALPKGSIGGASQTSS